MRIGPDTQASIAFGLGAVVLIEQLLAYQLAGVAPNDLYTIGGFTAIGISLPLGIIGARKNGG